MIKEDKVLIPINIRNISHYKNLEYDISLNDKELLVKVEDLSNGSKVRITCICDICASESTITYNKYIINLNRNNKGYYSCFKCKNIEKEKTCINRYGFISYSMTDDFKKSESEKWKGIRKGEEKGKETMLKRYGVDSYFKTDKSREHNRKWMSSDEFKVKSKNTLLLKYGVDSFSKTDEFKKVISDNKERIINNIKETFFDKYGVEWISKSEIWKEKYNENYEYIRNKVSNTCLLKYGVDNVSKVEFIRDKILNTKLEKGLIVPDELISDWDIYKKNCRRLTNNIKRNLFENWNGYDYYDGEFIKGNFCYTSTHRLYPTIDHKISVYFGFMTNIKPEDICNINNLCITKRFINSKKNKMIEEEFKFLLINI